MLFNVGDSLFFRRLDHVSDTIAVIACTEFHNISIHTSTHTGLPNWILDPGNCLVTKDLIPSTVFPV